MIEIALGIFFAALDDRTKKERKQQGRKQQEQQRTPKGAHHTDHTDTGTGR